MLQAPLSNWGSGLELLPILRNLEVGATCVTVCPLPTSKLMQATSTKQLAYKPERRTSYVRDDILAPSWLHRGAATPALFGQ